MGWFHLKNGPPPPDGALGRPRVAADEIDEELRLLDFKLGQLKRDYDQYFLGNRPREPVQLRGEINKAIHKLTSSAIKNTAARFKFSSICSRYQSHRRQWDETQRRIEAGTYERHRFRAQIHEDSGANGARSDGGSAGGTGEDLYRSYVDARLACGESVEGLSREKLERVISKQRAALREKFGDDSEFRFRVQIEGGKVRLKASRG